MRKYSQHIVCRAASLFVKGDTYTSRLLMRAERSSTPAFITSGNGLNGESEKNTVENVRKETHASEPSRRRGKSEQVVTIMGSEKGEAK